MVFCPIFVLLTPAKEIFSAGEATFSHGIKLTFALVYSGIFIWTFILFSGLIRHPYWIKSVMAKIFKWRILRRWQNQADTLGDNMVATSKALKTKPFKLRLEVFGATSLSWLSRYMVVNALFLDFCRRMTLING